MLRITPGAATPAPLPVGAESGSPAETAALGGDIAAVKPGCRAVGPASAQEQLTTSVSASAKFGGFSQTRPGRTELIARLTDEVMLSISAVRAGLVIEAS
jgi:hypothetical protein